MVDRQRMLAKRLKEARLENRLKQEQVAHYLKIPVSAVSAFESGRRKVDAIELHKLSKMYQRPMTWFFGEQEISFAKGDGFGNRRWYDGDPLVLECLSLLEKSPKILQRSALKGIIGFLNQG